MICRTSSRGRRSRFLDTQALAQGLAKNALASFRDALPHTQPPPEGPATRCNLRLLSANPAGRGPRTLPAALKIRIGSLLHR